MKIGSKQVLGHHAQGNLRAAPPPQLLLLLLGHCNMKRKESSDDRTRVRVPMGAGAKFQSLIMHFQKRGYQPVAASVRRTGGCLLLPDYDDDKNENGSSPTTVKHGDIITLKNGTIHLNFRLFRVRDLRRRKVGRPPCQKVQPQGNNVSNYNTVIGDDEEQERNVVDDYDFSISVMSLVDEFYRLHCASSLAPILVKGMNQWLQQLVADFYSFGLSSQSMYMDNDANKSRRQRAFTSRRFSRLLNVAVPSMFLLSSLSSPITAVMAIPTFYSRHHRHQHYLLQQQRQQICRRRFRPREGVGVNAKEHEKKELQSSSDAKVLDPSFLSRRGGDNQTKYQPTPLPEQQQQPYPAATIIGSKQSPQQPPNLCSVGYRPKSESVLSVGATLVKTRKQALSTPPPSASDVWSVFKSFRDRPVPLPSPPSIQNVKTQLSVSLPLPISDSTQNLDDGEAIINPVLATRLSLQWPVQQEHAMAAQVVGRANEAQEEDSPSSHQKPKDFSSRRQQWSVEQIYHWQQQPSPPPCHLAHQETMLLNRDCSVEEYVNVQDIADSWDGWKNNAEFEDIESGLFVDSNPGLPFPLPPLSREHGTFGVFEEEQEDFEKFSVGTRAYEEEEEDVIDYLLRGDTLPSEVDGNIWNPPVLSDSCGYGESISEIDQDYDHLEQDEYNEHILLSMDNEQVLTFEDWFGYSTVFPLSKASSAWSFHPYGRQVLSHPLVTSALCWGSQCQDDQLQSRLEQYVQTLKQRHEKEQEQRRQEATQQLLEQRRRERQEAEIRRLRLGRQRRPIPILAKKLAQQDGESSADDFDLTDEEFDLLLEQLANEPIYEILNEEEEPSFNGEENAHDIEIDFKPSPLRLPCFCLKSTFAYSKRLALPDLKLVGVEERLDSHDVALLTDFEEGQCFDRPAKGKYDDDEQDDDDDKMNQGDLWILLESNEYMGHAEDGDCQNEKTDFLLDYLRQNGKNSAGTERINKSLGSSSSTRIHRKRQSDAVLNEMNGQSMKPTTARNSKADTPKRITTQSEHDDIMCRIAPSRPLRAQNVPIRTTVRESGQQSERDDTMNSCEPPRPLQTQNGPTRSASQQGTLDTASYEPAVLSDFEEGGIGRFCVNQVEIVSDLASFAQEMDDEYEVISREQLMLSESDDDARSFWENFASLT